MSQVGDAVLQMNLVMKEKEIVMGLGMAASMMGTGVARVALSVVPTTAKSLVLTIMRRMIAVKNHQVL